MRIAIAFLGALALIVSACGESGGTRHVSDEGYEYVLHTRSGSEKPQPGEYAFFHAQIRKGDSIVYVTRESNPTTPFLQIPEAGVPAPPQGSSPIEGVLANMSVGDSATLFIPLDSLPQIPPDFAGADEIIYDLVLTDIKDEEGFMAYQQQMQAEAEAATAEAKEKFDALMAQYESGELNGQVEELESGLRYIVLQPGSGPQAEVGDVVSVDYYGVMADSTESFDNSYQRGIPYTFPLGQGQVIPGWDEGVAKLQEGAEALLLIPSDLGYGPNGYGSIPPDADLVFYVNLVKVEKQQ